jgi:anti-sigma factor RsiW
VRARNLMMAALDDELPSGDRAELERLLAADEELREEWNQMRRVKELTGVLGYRQPPDEVWDDFWQSSYAQVERGLAWVLISIGVLVLVGAGLYQAVFTLLEATGVPAYIKYAIFAAALGGVILGVSVLREKLFVRSHDRYKEVKR